jgi:zinc protease
MESIVRKRLPNGLHTLCQSVRSAPVVALQAWVGVGAADETASQAGLAHLHEHMLFKGTRRRAVGELARAVESVGGEVNAWTSFDQTVYHVVVPASEVELGLDVLSDALQHSTFDPEELRRESEVVVEEILRAQDNPARRLSQAMFSLAYSNHPYRLPVLGTQQSVRGFTREGILSFYRHYYRPDNLTLIAVGDFEPATLAGQIDHAFGSWAVPPTPLARPPRPVEAPVEQLRLQRLVEDVNEARFALAWAGPSLHAADLAAVDVLATLMGHGESSRLFDALHRRQGLVSEIGASAYTPTDPGLLMVSASLPAKNLLAALQQTVTCLVDLCARLPGLGEVRRAQTLLLSDDAYARETVQGQARKVGFFAVAAGDIGFEATYQAAVRAVRPAGVVAAARALFAGLPSVVLQHAPNEAEDLDDAAVRAALAPLLKLPPAPAQRGRASGAAAVQREILPNGAILLLAPDAGPVVSLRAVGLGGLRYEKPQQAGLAHLASSVWGTATQRLGPAALAQRVAECAGSIGGFCGRNSEGLSGDFIAEHGSAGVDLFAELLATPAFLPEQIERERAVILERLKSRADHPASVASDVFGKTMYPTHSYGQNVLGTPEALAGFTQADLLAHRQTFLASGRLVVAVCGGFDVERVRDVVQAALAGSAAPDLPAPLPVDPPPTAPRRAHPVLDRKQSHVLIGCMGTTLLNPDRYGLEVLSTILSGQSGRLFAELRDQQSLAYAISSSSLEGLDPGYFYVHVGTSPEKVKQACDGVHRHLDRLIDAPVSEAELQRAKHYLLGNHAIGLQLGGSRALSMALGEAYGLGYADYLKYAEHLAPVSVSSLQALAQQYLPSSRRIEVVCGPQ